jgi:hypothetical protein
MRGPILVWLINYQHAHIPVGQTVITDWMHWDPILPSVLIRRTGTSWWCPGIISEFDQFVQIVDKASKVCTRMMWRNWKFPLLFSTSCECHTFSHGCDIPLTMTWQQIAFSDSSVPCICSAQRIKMTVLYHHIAGSRISKGFRGYVVVYLFSPEEHPSPCSTSITHRKAAQRIFLRFGSDSRDDCTSYIPSYIRECLQISQTCGDSSPMATHEHRFTCN